MQRYFKLRPSGLLAFLLVLLSLFALVSLWLLPLPTALKLALTVILLTWGGYCLLLGAYLRLGRSCVAFRLDNSEEIVLVLRNGIHMPGRLSPDCLVTPYLVILNVVLSERRGTHSLLVMPDTMGADSFRHLRIALRWGDKANQLAI